MRALNPPSYLCPLIDKVNAHRPNSPIQRPNPADHNVRLHVEAVVVRARVAHGELGEGDGGGVELVGGDGGAAQDGAEDAYDCEDADGYQDAELERGGRVEKTTSEQRECVKGS